MKNKRMVSLKSWNILLIFGTTVGLLALPSSQMVSASYEGSNASNSNQEAIDHINQAQSALQNGDTEGAQMHMDSAKQALGCNKIIDPNC
jgi:hypothetical protein